MVLLKMTGVRSGSRVKGFVILQDVRGLFLESSLQEE